MFINRVAYKRKEKTEQSRVCLFISESEFNRDISILVKGAKSIKLVTFPRTVRDAHTGAFETSGRLRTVVMNEGLERLEGRGCDGSQQGGVFNSAQIKKIILSSTLRTLGNTIFQNCKMLKHVIF